METRHLIASVVLVYTTLLSSHPALGQFSQQGPKFVGTGGEGKAKLGRSVCLSADGNTALVGGPDDNGNAGAAWVWTRSGGVWTQQGTKLVGSGAVGNAFQGFSVALSADGNTAIVGGYGDSGFDGAAWVWTRSGAVWTQQGAKLVGSGVIGNANQGYSVSLSADGNTAIIGGVTDNGNAGAAWVWTRSGAVWTQQGAKLVGLGAKDPANQGWSVSLSASGNTAIVGGPFDNSNAGAAWVWTRSGAVWTQQGAKLVGSGAVGTYVYQGWSVSLSNDGNTAIVGGPQDSNDAGAAWVWTRSGTVWTQQGAKLVGSGIGGAIATQGGSVSLSADGNTAIVGGGFDNYDFSFNTAVGAVWVWTRSGAVWTQQGSKLVGSGAMGNAEQGTSVSLSTDGKTVIVGGPFDNSDTGAAWVFAAADQAHPIITSFKANPSTITSGQSSTLSWTTTNATSVAMSGVAGTQSANGSVSVFPTASTTYTLTATGSGGTATAITTVTVNAASPQAPIPMLLGSATTPGAITTGGAKLYIGSGNNVVSMPIAGGLATTLYAAAAPCCVLGITQTGGNLFWIDPNGDPDATAIFRGPVGGGMRTKIYSGFASGQPIVDGSGLTTDGSRLYAVDEVGGNLVSMNLDGSAITKLGSRYSGGFSTEHLNRVTVSGGILYIADEGCNCPGGTIAPKIVRMTAGGGGFTTLFDAGPGFAIRPHDIAVVGNSIFFTDSVNNTIWKMPTSGGTPTAFIAGAPFSRVDGITALGDALYVTDSVAGRVYEVAVSEPAGQVVKRRVVNPTRTLQVTSLSSMQVDPFSLLTVNGSGFDPAAKVSVRFTLPTGAVDIPSLTATATQVRVAVPPVVNFNDGTIGAGPASVQVIQTYGTASRSSNTISGLQIHDLLQLTQAAGTIASAFADAEIQLNKDTEAYLGFVEAGSGEQIQTAAWRAKLENANAAFSTLKQQIKAIAAGTVTSYPFGSLGNTPITLDARSLALEERILVTLLAQISSGAGASLTPAASATATAALTDCPPPPPCYVTPDCVDSLWFEEAKRTNDLVDVIEHLLGAGDIALHLLAALEIVGHEFPALTALAVATVYLTDAAVVMWADKKFQALPAGRQAYVDRLRAENIKRFEEKVPEQLGHVAVLALSVVNPPLGALLGLDLAISNWQLDTRDMHSQVLRGSVIDGATQNPIYGAFVRAPNSPDWNDSLAVSRRGGCFSARIVPGVPFDSTLLVVAPGYDQKSIAIDSNSLQQPILVALTPSSPAPGYAYVLPNPLPNACLGIPYSFNLDRAVGGTPPYYYVKQTGSQFPPLGLVIQPAGLLTGTPTTAGTSMFTVDAIDLGGHVASSTTSLTVLLCSPTVVSFTANPSAITAGQTSVLSWTTTNAASVSISGVPGSQPANSSVSVSPAVTTTYTLTATGPGGASSATTTLTVGSSGGVTGIAFSGGVGGFGSFVNGTITPAGLSGISITCGWVGNLGSKATRTTTTLSSHFTCSDADVSSWPDISLIISATVTGTTLTTSRTYP